jgi:hypothetical protein
MTDPRPHTEPRPPTEVELVEFVRSIDVRAPDSLHRQVESLVAEKSPLARRRRIGGSAGAGARRSFGSAPRLAAGAIAAAVVAVAIAVSLGGGGSSGLSIRQASALTLGPATAPAPPESPSHRAQLDAAVDGVTFPYWEERYGWRSTGARTDRVGGRTVTTVFYADGRGRRIGYTIVAGAPAPRSSGGAIAWRGQTPYRLLTEHGAPVVSWLRDGHLCVVSGRGVSSATLLALASSDNRGSVAS